MIMEAISLNNRMFQNTKGQSFSQFSKDKYCSIVVNMDFNKWNSFMRREETDGIFSDFGNLFGFNRVFTRTQGMFKLPTL
ncbi:unnamed protein product [Macrosiphum euphorbiae]|uniref:RdRp catalytic domain-containing protein n=1 Tax=Macrosiphum euphorbiae TaxID=13131 RepID=A0AAV0WJJ8_9HEMI|nr:unnamed protein product [Macrosiphum euphorbiae]